MRKILFLLFISGMMFNSVYAEQLVLSDVIQQARDAIRMQEAREKAELAMMQPVTSKKDETIKTTNEQTAAEKLNIYPNENTK